MTLALDATDLGRSLGERFDAIAKANAGKVAIRTPVAAITYDGLKQRSDRIAGWIHACAGSVDPCAIVLALPQGIDAIAAQLGILRAGAFYVPADARDPPARIRALVEHVGSRVVIAERECATGLRGIVAPDVQVADIDELEVGAASVAHVPYPDPLQLAYVYYTSGSTGEPKGVADTHRNVLHNVLRYTRSLAITADDRLTLLQPPTFSGAVSSTYAALLNGGTLLPYDLHEHGPGGLADFIARSEATIYHSVPTLFRNLVAGRARFPALRCVRLEGDRALGRDALLFQKYFAPPCQLVNGLGTTETGLARQYFVTHDTPVADGPLPIGYAVTDTECAVVDAHGLPVNDGEVGEIVVISEYLANGYWRDDALTRRKFEVRAGKRQYRTGDRGRLRPDGCLEYLGRAESEPRVRGVTIDRAALERVLLRVPGVADAAVATTEDADGDAVLIAAVAIAAGSRLDEQALRAWVRDEVPERAMPAHFVVTDALPLTAFGKIDRAAIARMVATPPCLPADEGREEIERQVVGIWRSVLGREAIETTRGFLYQGGDSLQAMQILVRIGDRFGVALSPAQFFALSTVAEQASFLRTTLASGAAL